MPLASARLRFAGLVLLLVTAAPRNAPAAQERKLSDLLEQASLHQVGAFALGSNGRVLYQGGSELYSVPMNGSASVSEILAALEPVSEILLTPDGVRTVLRAGRNDLHRLYSLESDGSGLPTLLAEGAGLAEFRLTPDGQRVVYRLGSGLFSVPIDGSLSPVALSTGLTPDSFEITADSEHVLFKESGTRLMTVPIEGGVAVDVHPALPSNRSVLQWALAPDGARVVYRLNLDIRAVLGPGRCFRAAREAQRPAGRRRQRASFPDQSVLDARDVRGRRAPGRRRRALRGPHPGRPEGHAQRRHAGAVHIRASDHSRPHADGLPRRSRHRRGPRPLLRSARRQPGRPESQRDDPDG